MTNTGGTPPEYPTELMQLRNAGPGDLNAILELYRRVAAVPGGLARLADEIDEAYVTSFLTNSLSRGLCLVAGGPSNLQGEIHAYTPVPRCFSHVLSDLTIAVDPSTQGKGLGRCLFETFMQRVEETYPRTLRVELIARESNAKAIHFYETLGFVIEGRMARRITSVGGGFESDIPMAWLRV